MSKPSAAAFPSKESMVLLSQMLLPPQGTSAAQNPALVSTLRGMSRERFEELVALASSNHVIIRAMEVVAATMRQAGDGERVIRAEEARSAEQARIENALSFLSRICSAFEEEGLDVTVIKSLDHWPDLGSDLDLYTNTDPVKVGELMGRRFNAQLAARSWGDRLARKWNFEIPGLPEAVEIHMGRLGQTGEQVAMAASIHPRSRQVEIGGKTFRVTSVSDRIMISTLQRMYRHFYFRLCDILDSAGLVENGLIDYDDLQRVAQRSDIWEGVATYLVIVSDYVQQYRGTGLDLPRSVRSTARFGGDHVYYAKEFLRVPIVPQSATLYRQQFSGMLRKGELHSTARLGLLPALATAALVGMKLTGSDKGIW
ncbi:MAG TPA: hypothetical protein VHU89_11200 [Acidobacteriaceae bacterium]|nr:hypothetical protein [Acidobacteriaceae bacterium]